MDDLISSSEVASARLALLAKLGYRQAGNLPVVGSGQARKVFAQQHLETAPDATIQEELAERNESGKWSWYCGPQNPFTPEEMIEIEKILTVA